MRQDKVGADLVHKGDDLVFVRKVNNEIETGGYLRFSSFSANVRRASSASVVERYSPDS